MADKLKRDDKGKYGTLAFITSPQYRIAPKNRIIEFAANYLYPLTRLFHVVSTGGTHEFFRNEIRDITFDEYNQKHGKLLLRFDENSVVNDEADFEKWKKCISEITRFDKAFTGMIKVISMLVEGKIQAVIHLKDWQDISAKPDSEVLSREANVHNIPIATNFTTAEAFTRSWVKQVIQNQDASLFNVRENVITLTLDAKLRKGEKALALVAHDKMKLDICKFAVQYAEAIAQKYKCIIATGTTGKWITRFLEARFPANIPFTICPCYSGPLGGDLQIANAIIEQKCDKIIFFQDPSSNHPHESDIRLFEQAVISEGVCVQMATNFDSAKLLIGAIEYEG